MNTRPTLRRREEFQRAFRKGTRAWQENLQVRTYQRGDGGPAHLGVVIRSTTMKRAVRRNRLRRLIREAFMALQAEIMPGTDVVVIPQGEPQIDHLRFIAAALARALRKCQVWEGTPPPWPEADQLPRNPRASGSVT